MGQPVLFSTLEAGKRCVASTRHGEPPAAEDQTEVILADPGVFASVRQEEASQHEI
jgi:hypothetical protein